MKKIIYMVILFAAFVVVGCENESYRSFDETQVEIEESNVIFTAKGGTGAIVVASSVKSVSATSDQSWCALNVSGNTITVTVSENMNMSGRTALVTIRSNDKVNYVPVTQASVHLTLDSYETVTFLGRGGTISFPYECDASVTVISEYPWLTGTVSGNAVTLTASANSDFLESRTAKIKIVAGNNLAMLQLNVLQGELITSYEPDPDINTVDNFLNLKNNGTSSRYKITYFSPGMETLYRNLRTSYPILQEIRVEAPRSSYKLSVILYNLDGATASYYYWNATNGLVPVDNSKSVAAFAFSGNSYGGVTAPYTATTNYTQLRAIFASDAGFTVIPDEDNTYWFRSVNNPMDYFKVEPASW
ncbi:MAG: hypothetical protein LBJ72_06895 [Dysgonamonadaceae bacterium]|jgi:hypothetical protein|nr:hypothetical protein [Dysgonamonadaceae bacterium]